MQKREVGGWTLPMLLIMHVISQIPTCYSGVVWSVTYGSLNATCTNSTSNNEQLNPSLVLVGSAQLGTNGYLFGGKDCNELYWNGVVEVDLLAQTTLAVQQYTLVSNDPGMSGPMGVSGAAYRPSAREATCMWASGEFLFAYGGVMNQYWADFWSFNLTSRSWANLSSGSGEVQYPSQMGMMGSFTPGSRSGCGTAQNGSHLFLMGGQGFSAGGYIVSVDIWTYVIAVQGWTWIGGSSTSAGACGFNNSLPGGLFGQCYASSPRGEIWQFGGVSGLNCSNELWYWNPTSSNLARLGGSCFTSQAPYKVSTESPMPRYYCSLVLYQGVPVLFGGKGNTTATLNDLWVYESSLWSQKTNYDSSVLNWVAGSSTLGPNYAGVMFALPEALVLVTGGNLGDALIRVQPGCVLSGFYLDPTTLTCLVCGVGMMLQNQSCVKCPPGKSSLGNGSLSCYECTVGSYAVGGHACLGCPSGATTFLTASTSVSQCFCASGFYGAAYLNQACTSCVGIIGITCPVNSTIPYVFDGYARDPTNANSALTCVPNIACLTTGSNLSTTCALGYMGGTCGSCSSGFFREGLYCKGCPSPYLGVLLGALIVVAVLVVISVVAYYNKSCALNPLLRVTLTSLQFIGTFPLITASWPSALQSFLNAVSLVNLNIDLVSPECTFGPVTIYAKLAFKLALPIITWLLLSVLIAFSVSLRSKDSSFRAELSGRVGPVGLAAVLCSYTLAVQASLQPFQCLQQPNGRYTLYSDPATFCYEGSWMQFLPMYVVGLLLYIVAVPVCLALLFKRLASSKALQSRYEFTLQDYRVGYAWWELINMLRRACLVAVISLILGQAKYFVAILALLSFIIIEIMVAPYKDSRLWQYSVTWGFVCLLTLIAVGAVFQSTEVSDSQKAVLGIFIILMIVVTAVFSLSMRIIRCCCPQRRVAIFADGSMVHALSLNGLSLNVAVPPVVMTSSIKTVSVVVELGAPQTTNGASSVEVYQASSVGQSSIAF